MDEIGGDYKNRPDQVMLFAQETPKALDFLLELGNSGDIIHIGIRNQDPQKAEVNN